MSGCASESRAVITLCSDGAICSLRRAAATLCPFSKAPQNIQMFAGCAWSRRAGINNGIGIQRHDPKWSGGQLRGYHEKTHTSYDRAGSGTWRGVGSGFLDERSACSVKPRGRRLSMGCCFFLVFGFCCFGFFFCVMEDLCLRFGGQNERWNVPEEPAKTAKVTPALRVGALAWGGGKLGFRDLFWIYYVGDGEKGQGCGWVGACWEAIMYTVRFH